MENPTCFQIVTNYGCLHNNRHCQIHHRWYHRVPQQVIDCVCLFRRCHQHHTCSMQCMTSHLHYRLQLHLWFAHGEADLQLQAILCRTEGGAVAEPSTGVRTLLSNFQPYRVTSIRGCRLIGCPPDQNLQTGTSDVLHCSIISWWETLYLGSVFFLAEYRTP